MRAFSLGLAFLFAISPAYSTVDLGRGRAGDVLHIHHAPDPVNVRNGNFYLPVQDYYMSCFGFPLEVYRSYNSLSTRNGPFGKGWTFNYDIQIVVGEESGMKVVEADGFVNDYKAVEAEKNQSTNEVDPIVRAKKKEDIQYSGSPQGKGEAYYKDYRRKLQADKAFFERQRDRYLPAQSKASASGKYVSRKRGTTFLTKTKNGFLRTTETGRSEEYNSKGLLIRLSDRNGNELTLEYNAESRLTKVNDGCGQSIQSTYNPRGKIVEILDSLGRRLTYTYDAKDRLISAVALDGGKTTFTYDDFDRMTSLVFGDGEKAEIFYDSKNGYVSKQVGPGSKVTEYKYGKEKETVWASVQDNEGGKGRYEYIDAENKIIFIDKNGNKTITTVTACCGKPLSIKDPKGVGEDFRYDGKGNLISKTDAAKKTTAFTYEPRFNQVSEIKNHDGTTMRFLYDKTGNLSFATSSDGKHVKLSYEKHGKIEKMTDHNENTVIFSYNSFGKPLTIEKKVKANRVGIINVTYDKTGEITSVVYEPKDPEVVQNIKDTLASFLRLLKPTGIDFEI
ncbi:MAG TPA: DUF6531 domain-containing protein [Bdellovibrionota bacterium]|nr:DUF6531 domain-containing protein [Bdellovibrionota bacterium]